MSLYHFTSRIHMPVILTDGFLKPSESNVSIYQPHVGPPVVWLVDLPEIEPASHGLRMPEGNDLDKTEVRFEVDVPAIRWRDWEWTARMEDSWRNTLMRIGGGVEAASHWYVWPAPIRRRRWRSVTLEGQPLEHMLEHPDPDTL